MSRDKPAKFVELANKRVNKGLKDINLVSNLADLQNHEYTEDLSRKIVKTLQQGVDFLKQGFWPPKTAITAFSSCNRAT